MPSRRAVLALATASLTGTAGCTSFLTTSGSAGESTSVRTDSFDIPPGAFAAFLADQRDRWADHSVFGQARDDGDAGLRGAWTGPVTNPEWDDGPRFTGRWGVVLYRLDDRHRAWCWAVAEPEPTDRGRTTLTELTVGVSATDPDTDLLRYAPGSTLDAESAPHVVSLGGSGASGPTGQVFMDEGRIQPEPDSTRVGGGGEFTIGWSGRGRAAVSIVGVCEFAGPVTELTASWHVRAGRSLV